MPWFAVDDGFDTHPKTRKAGNAAAGLFGRLGAFAARHLTDGLIPATTVRDYGTPPQIRKLLQVGFLHSHGHQCGRCEQPAKGDYVIHDYLDYNRSRKQIEAAREAGRKRQAKGRETQAETRSDANRSSTGVRNEPQLGSESNLTRDSIRIRNEPHFDDETAGQEDPSRRDTLQGPTVVPSHPLPSQASPTEKPASKTAGPNVPAFAGDLVRQLTAAGMVVGWGLSEPEWFRVHAHIKRCGVEEIVQFTRDRWNPADPPRTARYLTRMWTEMPDMDAPGSGLPALRAVDAAPPVSPKLAARQASRDLLDQLSENLRQQQAGETA